VVAGVGAPDDVGGQAALDLEPRERLERRGRSTPRKSQITASIAISHASTQIDAAA